MKIIFIWIAGKTSINDGLLDHAIDCMVFKNAKGLKTNNEIEN